MHRAETADGATRTIRFARPEESAALSALAFRSKGYWGYDHNFLEAVRETLIVTAASSDQTALREPTRDEQETR